MLPYRYLSELANFGYPTRIEISDNHINASEHSKDFPSHAGGGLAGATSVRLDSGLKTGSLEAAKKPPEVSGQT